MGRAIVTTDSPGCRATVRHGGNGFLVPVRDGAALADAMSDLAEDRELVQRFAAESRKMAVGKYDVRLVTAEILAFMGVH